MSPLPHRRAKSAAEDVERLVAKVNVQRRAEGGGTLLTEPLIIARGMHQERLELLDQHGHQLGIANPVPPGEGSWLEELGRSLDGPPTSYEICDTDGRCVLMVRKVKLRIGVRLRGCWTYEVRQPGDRQSITLSKAGWWSTRSYSVAEGPHEIGLLRTEVGVAWPAVQDEFGRTVGRVLFARGGSFSKRIAVVLELQDGSPGRLRKVALAAIVIADVEFNSG